MAEAFSLAGAFLLGENAFPLLAAFLISPSLDGSTTLSLSLIHI